ncbi:hypothetical protein AAE028_31160 [Sinorhizobium sp. CB9]
MTELTKKSVLFRHLIIVCRLLASNRVDVARRKWNKYSVKQILRFVCSVLVSPSGVTAPGIDGFTARPGAPA